MSRRPRSLVVVLAVFLALISVVGSMSTATAAPTACVFDEMTGRASVTVGEGLVATISREGDAIEVDGIVCGTATVHNTDLITATTPAVSVETVAVDLSGGAFAPGQTDEGDGSSEIEFDVQLGGAAPGPQDQVQVIGTSGPDVFTADGLSANLDASESAPDDDLTVSTGDGELELLGGDGDDRIELLGYGGAGLEIPKKARGGPGDDRLFGDLNESLLDGGEGRDVADYSPAGFELSIVWNVSESFIFGEGGTEDGLDGFEVAVLSYDHDVAVYQGAATGETRLGGGVDSVIVQDPVAGGTPTDRIVRGGPGPPFDFLTFGSTPEDPVNIELKPNSVGGSWTATYSGFEYVEAGSGDDRFRISARGSYPTLIGRDGVDLIDLRAASQGINVTLGQRTFGTRTWIHAFEVERVHGSDFNDVVIGPVGFEAAHPKVLIGFLGRDFLRGGDGPDVLLGGAGNDTLRGRGGADSIRGNAGDDLLGGGTGPDLLRGGGGDDTLRGGPGADDCDGGPGLDHLTDC